MPTLIRGSGLQRVEVLQKRWSAAGHVTRPWGDEGLQVAACNGSKVELLRQLLAEDSPSDVEILAPSLEDLYRHYMNSHQITAQEAAL